MRSRSIADNLLLAQELHDSILNANQSQASVIVKLDMAKAYDKLSWDYFTWRQFFGDFSFQCDGSSG